MVELSKNYPLAENENPSSRSNQEQGTDKEIKIWKGVEGHTIAVGVEARAEACGKSPQRKGSYTHREESMQASTTIHLQGNRTFVVP